MKQKSTKNVNNQPTETLLEISFESDSGGKMSLVSGLPKVIVAKSGSETEDTSKDGDISEKDCQDEPLDTLLSASNLHFLCDLQKLLLYSSKW